MEDLKTLNITREDIVIVPQDQNAGDPFLPEILNSMGRSNGNKKMDKEPHLPWIENTHKSPVSPIYFPLNLVDALLYSMLASY